MRPALRALALPLALAPRATRLICHRVRIRVQMSAFDGAGPGYRRPVYRTILVLGPDIVLLIVAACAAGASVTPEVSAAAAAPSRQSVPPRARQVRRSARRRPNAWGKARAPGRARRAWPTRTVRPCGRSGDSLGLRRHS